MDEFILSNPFHFHWSASQLYLWRCRFIALVKDKNGLPASNIIGKSSIKRSFRLHRMRIGGTDMASKDFESNLKNLKGTFAIESMTVSEESIKNLKRIDSGKVRIGFWIFAISVPEKMLTLNSDSAELIS